MMERKPHVANATFSLIIRGDELPFDVLQERLALDGDVRKVRKGEELNRLPLIVAPEDELVWTIPLTEPEGEDPRLTEMLAQLVARKDVMAELTAAYRVNLRMYVQSDRAQIAYRLMPETLSKLVATGLPLDVTSLSWGEIRL